MNDTCQHCGGLIAVRNPTGKCDHLYWPDNLTDEARIANGLVPRSRDNPNDKTNADQAQESASSNRDAADPHPF